MSNSQTVTAKNFCCNGCGAPLKIPSNSRGHVQCPACRNDCVLEGLIKNAEIAAKENIQSGVPLSATPAVLHRQLVSLLYGSPNIPLDAFEKIEVIREERHCVPAYQFYCNGTASFTYMAVNIRQHKTTQDLGDRSRTVWENYEEETLSNGSTSVSPTLFAPGEKRLAPQVQQLYMQLNPDQLASQLVDIEELDFPPDVETYAYNLPQPASFNEYVKPHVDKLLEEQANKSLKGKKVHSLTMAGSNIQRDSVRVFLGLYHVVYRYGDKEYSMWATGDGQKVLNDKLPADPQRQKIHDEKQQVVASIPSNNTGGVIFWLVTCVLAAIASFGSPWFLETPMLGSMLVGLAFVGGAVICGVMLPKVSQVGKERDEERAKAQKDLDDFDALLPNAVQRFKSQKKALRGIYAEVTGDASAF